MNHIYLTMSEPAYWYSHTKDHETISSCGDPSSIQQWPPLPPRRRSAHQLYLYFHPTPPHYDFCELQRCTRKSAFTFIETGILWREDVQVVHPSNLPNLISLLPSAALRWFMRAHCHKCLISIIKVSDTQYHIVQQRERQSCFHTIEWHSLQLVAYMLGQLNQTLSRMRRHCDALKLCMPYNQGEVTE